MVPLVQIRHRVSLIEIRRLAPALIQHLLPEFLVREVCAYQERKLIQFLHHEHQQFLP